MTVIEHFAPAAKVEGQLVAVNSSLSDSETVTLMFVNVTFPVLVRVTWAVEVLPALVTGKFTVDGVKVTGGPTVTESVT